MASEGLLAQIANPRAAQTIGEAMDYRERRIQMQAEQERKRRLGEMVAESVPHLREGSKLKMMAMEDPESFLMFTKAMGIPVNQGQQLQQFEDDLWTISNLANQDMNQAVSYVSSLVAERGQMGIDSTQLSQFLALAQQDPSKAYNALNVLNQSVNGDRIAAAEMAQREMAIKERRLDIDERGLESGGNLGTYNPRDYTTESWAKFLKSKDANDLKRYESSQIVNVGGVEYLVDRSDSGQGARTPISSLSEVSGNVAAIQDAKTRAEKEAINVTETSKKYFDQIGNIRENIANYQEGIRLLDEGASTGVLEKRLPSLKAASQKLDNLRNRLGLDVVGSTTFGALSEAELALALDTGSPSSLEPKELKKWFQDRMIAQQKLSDILDNAVQFLSVPGNSLADLRTEQRKQSANTNKVSTDKPSSREDMDAYLKSIGG